MTSLSAADHQILMAFAHQHRGDLDGLLRAFFQFLHQFTDLYVVDESPSKMGFKPGQAETKVLKAFRSYPYKSVSNPISTSTKSTQEPTSSKNKPSPLPKTSLEGVGSQKGDSNAKGGTQPSTKSLAMDACSPKTVSPDVYQSNQMDVSAKASSSDSVTEGYQSTSQTASLEASNSKNTPASYPVKPSDDLIGSRQTPSTMTKQVPRGNGGSGANYVWTQTLGEVQVEIPMIDKGAGIRAKDIECLMKPDSIRIKLKGNGLILLEGLFPPNESIDTSESTWTLSDSNLLLLLIKRRETWWPSVVRGDPEIDTSLVDSTKRIAEYDDETQAAIRKLMLEQQQQQHQ